MCNSLKKEGGAGHKQEFSVFKLVMSGSYLLLSGPWNMNETSGASLCCVIAITAGSEAHMAGGPNWVFNISFTGQ